MAICREGKIHTRAREIFGALFASVASKFRVRACVYFARHTIATAKIRDYSQSNFQKRWWRSLPCNTKLQERAGRYRRKNFHSVDLSRRRFYLRGDLESLRGRSLTLELIAQREEDPTSLPISVDIPPNVTSSIVGLVTVCRCTRVASGKTSLKIMPISLPFKNQNSPFQSRSYHIVQVCLSVLCDFGGLFDNSVIACKKF